MMWIDTSRQTELKCIGQLLEILLDEVPSFISYKPVFEDLRKYFDRGWPVQMEIYPQKNIVVTITVKPPIWISLVDAAELDFYIPE